MQGQNLFIIVCSFNVITSINIYYLLLFILYLYFQEKSNWNHIIVKIFLLLSSIPIDKFKLSMIRSNSEVEIYIMIFRHVIIKNWMRIFKLINSAFFLFISYLPVHQLKKCVAVAGFQNLMAEPVTNGDRCLPNSSFPKSVFEL